MHSIAASHVNGLAKDGHAVKSPRLISLAVFRGTVAEVQCTGKRAEAVDCSVGEDVRPLEKPISGDSLTRAQAHAAQRVSIDPQSMRVLNPGASRLKAEKRFPLMVWGDDDAPIRDLALSLLRQQQKAHRGSRHGRDRRRWSSPCRKSRERQEASPSRCSPSAPSPEAQRRVELHLKVACSQLLVLQRWEQDTRDLAARWGIWMLKVLRRASQRPRALQLLLFSVAAATLPRMCRSLQDLCAGPAREEGVEVLQTVRALLQALDKSRVCFTGLQWDVLRERGGSCRRLLAAAQLWAAGPALPSPGLPRSALAEQSGREGRASYEKRVVLAYLDDRPGPGEELRTVPPLAASALAPEQRGAAARRGMLGVGHGAQVARTGGGAPPPASVGATGAGLAEALDRREKGGCRRASEEALGPGGESEGTGTPLLDQTTQAMLQGSATWHCPICRGNATWLQVGAHRCWVAPVAAAGAPPCTEGAEAAAGAGRRQRRCGCANGFGSQIFPARQNARDADLGTCAAVKGLGAGGKGYGVHAAWQAPEKMVGEPAQHPNTCSNGPHTGAARREQGVRPGYCCEAPPSSAVPLHGHFSPGHSFVPSASMASTRAREEEGEKACGQAKRGRAGWGGADAAPSRRGWGPAEWKAVAQGLLAASMADWARRGCDQGRPLTPDSSPALAPGRVPPPAQGDGRLGRKPSARKKQMARRPT